MRPHLKYLQCIILLLPLMILNLEARAKTDVVVLQNGDTITGEIKSLQRGILLLKTDWMGTVQIEWPRIQEVRSEYFFEIILSNGQKSFGSIQPGQEAHQLEVVSQNFTVEANHLAIVSITPIEQRFLDRIQFSIEFGASYYTSNQSSKVSLGTRFSYRTEKYGTSADYSTILDQQKSGTRTKRNELKTNFQRYLSNNWSVIALASFLQSEELNLDLRSVFGGGISKELIQNNSVILTVMGGADVNREKYFEEEFKTSIEGLSGISFQTFRFDKPEVDVTSTFYAIPSFSDWGRIRLEFNTSLRFKLFSDLYWSASVFENYDNRGDPNHDFGAQTTFGWSFN